MNSKRPMYLKTVLVLASLLVSLPLTAATVFTIETTNTADGSVDKMELSADGKKLAMNMLSAKVGAAGHMIYRGDRREMLMVDDDRRTYFVMDEAAMRQLGGQLNAMMKQMEDALKNVPEGQREMVEKMMKQRMPQQADARPVVEVQRTNERATLHGYPCVKYVVSIAGQLKRELWVASWDRVPGGRETSEAMAGMAEFMSALMESMPQFGASALAENVFAEMGKIEGFPVVTRELDANGEVESEAVLRSAEQRSIAPEVFEAPKGYKRQQMPGGQ